MKIKKWLTVNSSESAKLTHNKPELRQDEVSILLDINLPDALFQKPRLEAKIEIPQEAAGPEVMNSEVVENVRDAIKQVTGLEFSINVIREPEDDNCRH